MARANGAAEPDGPLQARDVVAFGQEVGRVLSDGRIVGRAEPFAKVFPSSRAVKRAVGVTAWAILEDIALDARLDVEGRLVAETNVRRIGDNVGLSKNTVTRHLGRLRDHGFVLHEELRDRGSGRYEVSRYVLDPSACLERFTVTPTRGQDRDPSQVESAPDGRSRPCPRSGDTGPRPKNDDAAGRATVSQPTRHRDVGQKNKKVVGEDDQQLADNPLLKRLTALGVSADVAADLIAQHPADQIADALDAVEAQQVRRPAGWVVTAIRQGWDVTGDADDVRAQRAARRRRDQAQVRAASAADQDDRRRDHAEGWAAVVAAVLDDEQLRRLVDRLAPPVPGLGRRSVPMARARLTTWAAAAHQARPDLPLDQALAAAVDQPATDEPDPSHEMPPPPPTAAPTRPLDERIAACLRRLDPDHQPDLDKGVAR